MNDVIKFKIHIQGSLGTYEDFVADEVDREREEHDAAAPTGEIEEQHHDDMEE